MRNNLIILAMFLVGIQLGNAQFFEYDTPNEGETNYQSTSTRTTFFESDSEWETSKSPGNPGEEVPIDNWIYALGLSGVLLRIYFHQKKKNLATPVTRESYRGSTDFLKAHKRVHKAAAPRFADVYKGKNGC